MGGAMRPPTVLASNSGLRSGGRSFAGWATVARQNAKPSTEAEVIIERLALARGIVQRSIRDLGVVRADALTKQLRAILDPNEWESGDQVLGMGSLKTLIRTLAAADLSVGSLTITRSGNLACTWISGSETLRLEALGDGSVSWAQLCSAGAETRTSYGNRESIPALLAALAT